MITVITPTYNRENTLKKAYTSLVKQTEKNFEWLIIDDGSTDNTKKLIDKFIKENNIKIRYYYKKNGGKHTALNFGIPKAKGELLLFLDSDDYLTNNAIKLVNFYWDKYKDNDKLMGMTFLRKIINPIKCVKLFDEQINNMFEFRYNQNNKYDMCDIFRKDILSNNPYPVFDKERFLSEVIIFHKIANEYNMAYIPKEIYCSEYLEDGLTKNWFKLVTNNPNGARANSLAFMKNKKVKLSIRIKNCLTFGVFSHIARKSIIKDSNMKLLSIISYIPAWFIAKNLILKYKEEK